MDNGDILSDFFEDSEFAGDDIFSILEALDRASSTAAAAAIPSLETTDDLVAHKSISSSSSSPRSSKRQKINGSDASEEEQPRTCHITVERNRRKQMNDHLSVLRSLMPAFYVKRGDQASIIEGVVDYINELQQILQSLESKKQRKVYNEVLSPRLLTSPRPSPLSPRKPPLSPRLLNLPPISPRTPTSPYKPIITTVASASSLVNSSTRLSLPLSFPTITSYLLSPATTTTTTTTVAGSLEQPSPATSAIDSANELAANSKSAVADVEVKFSGSNVILKTVSPRIPGQAVKIISALEELALEILHVSISTINDDTSLNSYTIKIGIECQLSAEELAQQIQQTFR